MTPARRIVAGETHFISVKAVGDTFRFLPRPEVNAILLYALAVMVERYKIALHEFEFISNHYHLTLTDIRGVLPDFMRDLNMLISRSLNALRGTRGTVVEKGYNLVTPEDPDRVREHCLYTLLNAVHHRLVARVCEWGGISSFSMEYAQPMVVTRPGIGIWSRQADGHRSDAPANAPALARKAPANRSRARRIGLRSKLPETVELTLTRPPTDSHLSDAELRRAIRDEVERREHQAAHERASTGGRVLGMSTVLAQHWSDSPHSLPRLFETVPAVSATTHEQRAAARERNRVFQRRYQAARGKYLAGQRDVEFPAGTWFIVQRWGARSEPPTHLDRGPPGALAA